MVLLTGLMVAATGFIQRFFWNGKILWFFVPYDWGQPFSAGVPRASGPFVNADHFANYLAMIFPIAIACALYYARIVAKRLQPAWLTLCAASAFIVFTGILLSLSRGGWLSALAGLAVVLWVSAQRARRKEQRAGSREQVAGSTEHGAGIRGGDRLVAQSGDQSAKSEEHFGWNTKRRSRSSKIGYFRSAQVVRRLLMSRGGILVIVVGVLLITSLFFVGSGGREQVDERLGQTIKRDLGVMGRADLWRDTVKMVVDFPLFGVGLGAWPEVFVHYRQPPWSGAFYRAAHNDYVELLAETGFIGFALLGWFFFQLGRRLIQGVERSAATSFPLAAISIAALAAMALHEWFDSNLQIPANAFLFTLLASAGLRMVTEQRAGSPEHGAESTGKGFIGARSWWPGAGNEEQRAESKEKRIGDSDQGAWSWEPGVTNWEQGAWSWEHGTPISKVYRLAARQKMLVPSLVALSAAILVVCAVSQEQILYPYHRARPNSLAEAKKLVLSWPASVNAHLSFLLVMKEKTPLSSQLAQAKAALWVEPTNPYIRDFYAATLLSLNRKDEGLKEIAQSVGDSPLLRNHFYLAENFLQRLSESEQNAVERGLNRAFLSGYPDAQDSLAGFFVKLNRFADEAALYERMARSERDAGKKNELFINSAAAYLKAQDEGKAELLFRKAIVALPTDPRPYQELATRVYGRKDFLRAQEIVSQGIKNGAPAFSLYLSLAEAAQTTGNPSDRKRALSLAKTEIERAAKQVDDPYPFYVVLADASRKIGDRDQEVAALLKLLEFRPQSLDTLSRLAKVYFEQRNFDRAALYFSRIINIQPDTAEVYHQLAVAEEGRYHFSAADNAYARAVALDPDNAVYRERYEQFRKRIEQNKVSVDGKGRGLGPAAGSREPGARS